MAHFFEDLSKSEKHYEIKPPLKYNSKSLKFCYLSLLAPSLTEIKEEPQVEPEIDIKEDSDININGIKVNDTIIENDKKESIISEEEQNRISDEKVAEAIRNHNEGYYDKNDGSPLESDEDFKVSF